MRGWGVPHNSDPTTQNTNPDWGWGDEQTALYVPTADQKDYGWGSKRDASYPSFLVLETTKVADDGGYRVVIRGDFPRDGASLAQRIDGYTITLIDNTTSIESSPLYGSRLGRGTNVATNYQGTKLEFSTPLLIAFRQYTVRVTKSGVSEDVGTLMPYRRTRTLEEYAMRDACPEHWNVGVRNIRNQEAIQDAPSETNSNLSILIRALAQSLAEFKARGIKTRTTIRYELDDPYLFVESTLGAEGSGCVWVGKYKFKYSNKAGTIFFIDSVYPALEETINAGALVSYDPNI